MFYVFSTPVLMERLEDEGDRTQAVSHQKATFLGLWSLIYFMVRDDGSTDLGSKTPNGVGSSVEQLVNPDCNHISCRLGPQP